MKTETTPTTIKDKANKLYKSIFDSLQYQKMKTIKDVTKHIQDRTELEAVILQDSMPELQFRSYINDILAYSSKQIELLKPKTAVSTNDISYIAWLYISKTLSGILSVNPGTYIQEGKTQKSFRDYLVIDEKDKDNLLEQIKGIINGNGSGKLVATILEALQELNYLPMNSYTAQLIIDTFNLTCSKQSINSYLNKDTILQKEKQPYIDRFTM